MAISPFAKSFRSRTIERNIVAMGRRSARKSVWIHANGKDWETGSAASFASTFAVTRTTTVTPILIPRCRERRSRTCPSIFSVEMRRGWLSISKPIVVGRFSRGFAAALAQLRVGSVGTIPAGWAAFPRQDLCHEISATHSNTNPRRHKISDDGEWEDAQAGVLQRGETITSKNDSRCPQQTDRKLLLAPAVRCVRALDIPTARRSSNGFPDRARKSLRRQLRDRTLWTDDFARRGHRGRMTLSCGLEERKFNGCAFLRIICLWRNCFVCTS